MAWRGCAEKARTARPLHEAGKGVMHVQQLMHGCPTLPARKNGWQKWQERPCPACPACPGWLLAPLHCARHNQQAHPTCILPPCPPHLETASAVTSAGRL